MTRAFALSFAAALAAASFGALPTAASAQADGPDERYNQVIIYGDDPCPESSENEITVCARLDESERYRIPEILRDSDSPQNTSWTQRVKEMETVGAFGTLSCTPTGPGGALGCTQKLIDQAYEEKATSSGVHFSELIAEERAKRLSTIDADAAATQERVEKLEKEYEARQQAQQAAEDADAKDAAPASEQPASDAGKDLATPPSD